MDELYDRAMDKLRDEMAKAKGAVHMVGEIVTLYLMADPSNAEKILAEGKTLAGAYGKMRDLARRSRKECFDSDEAAALFAEYYGFEKRPLEEVWQEARLGRKTEPQAPAETPKTADVDELSLDYLLGL